MKCKIKYYRRYQIIIGSNYACVICKQNKGKCIPFPNLGGAVQCIDFLLEDLSENFYSLDDTKKWRR